MPTTAITTADIIHRYADDIARVAEQSPTSDLGTLAAQMGTAARNFSLAGINGHEDVDAASTYLDEASRTTDTVERDVFIRKADELLRLIVWDMTQEYREMVGD